MTLFIGDNGYAIMNFLRQGFRKLSSDSIGVVMGCWRSSLNMMFIQLAK